MTGTYIKINFQEFCDKRGYTKDNHPFLNNLDILTQTEMINFDGQTWIAGGSLLSIVSERISNALMEEFRLLPPDYRFRRNDLNPGHSIYCRDIDVFYSNFSSFKLHTRKWKIKSMLLKKTKTDNAIFSTTVFPFRSRWRTKTNIEKMSVKIKRVTQGKVVPLPEIQHIGFKNCNTLEELLDSFDIDVCQVGFDGKDLCISNSAFMGIMEDEFKATKTIEELGPRVMKTTGRMEKYEGKKFQNKTTNMQEYEDAARSWAMSKEACEAWYIEEGVK